PSSGCNAAPPPATAFRRRRSPSPNAATSRQPHTPGSAGAGPPAPPSASISAASRSRRTDSCTSNTWRTPGAFDRGGGRGAILPLPLGFVAQRGRNSPTPWGTIMSQGGRVLSLRVAEAGVYTRERFQKAMFGSSMTNFQQLFQMGQQVQARLSQLQTELGNRTVTCSSGGGMVTVTADGRGRVREVKIDPTVVDPSDVEMLEDLVTAAVAEAQQRAQQVYEEELKKVAGGFPLPFNLPQFP